MISQLLKFVLVLAVITTGACSRAFTTMTPVVEYSSVAIYSLSTDSFPDSDIRKELPPMKEFPQLTEENLKGILSMFQFRRDGIWGAMERNIYYREELEHNIPVVIRSAGKIGPEARMVVITRHDPDQSVLSRLERVTAIIWADEAGFNVLFGEIREPIPDNDPLTYSDWTDMLPISMKRAYTDLSLVENEKFQLKTIQGQIHRTWAVIPLDTLADFTYSDEENVAGGQTQTHSLTAKLEDLKKAREKGLITEEEYSSMRKEILRDY